MCESRLKELVWIQLQVSSRVFKLTLRPAARLVSPPEVDGLHRLASAYTFVSALNLLARPHQLLMPHEFLLCGRGCACRFVAAIQKIVRVGMVWRKGDHTL